MVDSRQLEAVCVCVCVCVCLEALKGFPCRFGGLAWRATCCCCCSAVDRRWCACWAARLPGCQPCRRARLLWSVASILCTYAGRHISTRTHVVPCPF